jgi:hypothetical protein
MDSNLKTSLQDLHARLAAAGPVDEELLELLRQLEGDIKQLVEKGPDPVADPLNPAALSQSYGMAERTQEISARFAAKHPQLEPALRELGTMLNSLGI